MRGRMSTQRGDEQSNGAVALGKCAKVPTGQREKYHTAATNKTLGIVLNDPGGKNDSWLHHTCLHGMGEKGFSAR